MSFIGPHTLYIIFLYVLSNICISPRVQLSFVYLSSTNTFSIRTHICLDFLNKHGISNSLIRLLNPSKITPYVIFHGVSKVFIKKK